MQRFININDIRDFDDMNQENSFPIVFIGTGSYMDINLLTAEQLRILILRVIKTPCVSEVLLILVRMHDSTEHTILLPREESSVFALKQAITRVTGIIPCKQIIHISRQPTPLSPELLPMISLFDEELVDSDEEPDDENLSDAFVIEGEYHIQLQPGDEITLGIQSMTRIYSPEESVAVLDTFVYME